MGRTILASLAVLGLGALASSTAMARDYPFCIKGCNYGGGGDAGECSFVSYQQCQATAAGLLAWCDVNPNYHGVAELQPGRRNRSPRRF
jgi:hypothetical protein